MNKPNDPAALAVLAQLLHGAAVYVEARAAADRAHDFVVKLSRRIVNDPLLSDEEAIDAAGARARDAMKDVRLEPEGAVPAEGVVT